MREQFSDEKLDKIMRGLVNTAAADEAVVDDVANSPATWWAVQRTIAATPARSPWPPTPKLWRLLLIGAPVAGVMLVIVGIFTLRQPAATVDVARDAATTNEAVSPSVVDTPRTEAPPAVESALPTITSKQPRRRAERRETTIAVAKKAPSEEIKTDFIALTHAPPPESGQVVRVKVPRSMMVSVGLVETVERPTSMVNAELVVGDDGQTHSIRFIKD